MGFSDADSKCPDRINLDAGMQGGGCTKTLREAHSPFPRRMFFESAAFSTSANAPIFFSTSRALLVLLTDSAASLSTKGTSGIYKGVKGQKT